MGANFTPKQWQNLPDTSTIVDAAALIDLEDRVTDYADSTTNAHVNDTSSAHTASAIAVSPAVGGDATVQAVLTTHESRLDAAQSGSGAVNPYDGGKWVALGDSITFVGNYTGPLAELLNVTLVNLGANGGTLSTEGAGNGLIFDALVSVDADADLITVEAGINDFLFEVELGMIADTDHDTSFYGALWETCAALIASNPTADIAFFTPYGNETFSTFTGKWDTPNGAGDRVEDFWTAIHAVCGLFGIPVIKVGEESGLGGATAAIYTSDNLHVTTAGGERYANYAYPRLIAAHVGESTVVAPTPAAPVNTVAPAITPSSCDAGDTLTCSSGTWTGYPAPSYARQWKRDGVNILGETASTYDTVGPDDVDADITCTVTATNTQGSASAGSNTVTPAASGGDGVYVIRVWNQNNRYIYGVDDANNLPVVAVGSHVTIADPGGGAWAANTYEVDFVVPDQSLGVADDEPNGTVRNFARLTVSPAAVGVSGGLATLSA